MGRQIKRVPLDFDWPIKTVWAGYLNPFYQYEKKCPFCDGSGHNAATKQIRDDWYDFAGTGRRWSDQLTQDEVDALVEQDRLHDLTRKFTAGQGWGPVVHHPTTDEVNAWSRHGIGHDSINHWICVEARAKRLGVWGQCEFCRGDGSLWLTKEYEQQSEAWERTEPPTGEGWQVWETVSEGSPISPVFPTDDACVEWLVGQGYSFEAASKFVQIGWVMSMAMVDGKIYKDIESAAITP